MDKNQYITRLKPADKRLIRSIGRLAQENGVRAFLVGGVVRDLILGRAVKDIDIVIEGNAGLIAEQWARSIGARCTQYPQFQTAHVCPKSGQPIDFISSRKEKYKRPGVLPQVAPGDIYDDLSRRDITVNAMAILITPVGFGRFYDEFSGCEDLKSKRIRVLHGNTFYDDPTRIFRVYRYALRLDFKIERWTARLIHEAVDRGVLQTITMNRYMRELQLVCKESSAVRILKTVHCNNILRRLGSVSNINFRIINMVGAQLLKYQSFVKNDDKSRFMLLALLEGVDVHKAGVPLDNELQECLSRSQSVPSIVAKLRRAKHLSEVYLLLSGLSDLMCKYIFLRTRSDNVQKKIKQYCEKLKNIQIQLNGNDLKRLGLCDIKKIKSMKKELLLAKIDGKIKRKNDETRLAKKLIAAIKE